MKEPPKAPAPKPGLTPFDCMTDLTRQVVWVPKTEVKAKKPKPR